MICLPAERDLIVAGATRLVVAGDRAKCPADTDGDGDCAACSRYPDVHGFVAPQRWVDATGPCRYRFENVECVGGVLRGIDNGYALGRCRENCIDGHKREALQVEPPPTRGRITFAYATVEVLPVYDMDASRFGISVEEPHVWLHPDNGAMIWRPRQHPIWQRCEALDPLPVPGRDWVVLLDNVELL